MNLEFIDTIKASDSFMTEDGDQSAKSMAYAHLSKTGLESNFSFTAVKAFSVNCMSSSVCDAVGISL